VSFLGIDVGTSGCKAAVFSPSGRMLASAYEEYDMVRPRPGWAELDPADVWARVRRTVAKAVRAAEGDPVRALAVSSMGEALVPVSADRRILGPSLLMNDGRGEEYVPALATAIGADRFHRINGNVLGGQYSLPKLLWTRDHSPDVYAGAWKFLPWSGFVAFMLGAGPTADWSLAGRTLLFDVDARRWSDEIAGAAGIDLGKLPDLVPAGARLGTVDAGTASELGLPRDALIVAGPHDQCANAVGCGVVDEGLGMISLGSWLSIVPVFTERRPTQTMLPLGLNIECHAVPDRFVTFIYNQGGLLLKWYRDTFARADHESAARTGTDVYTALVAETPEEPSSVLVLPHFTVTGPPEFLTGSSGAILGLTLETSRADILKGIMEGAVFYQRALVDSLAGTGIRMRELRVVGGGSRSDAWPRIAADILDLPLVATAGSEAGTLGAAIIAAAGAGEYSSIAAGAAAMVAPGRRFDPDPRRVRAYRERYERYRALWPAMKNLLATA
jgi:xylulokinase